MKFGFRVPSLKRRIAAHTSWKRMVRHSMGLKMPRGYGFLTNPKKALYNKVYRKATFGLGGITGPIKQHIKSPKIQTISNPTQIGISSRNIVLDKHFEILEKIQFYYRQRYQAGMLEKAIGACKEQIALAPQAAAEFLKEYPQQPLPSHTGYEQLVIILAHQEKQSEAMALCKQAKKEGWSGSWDKMIKRYSSTITAIF